VVFACHGDEALAVLDDSGRNEKEILSSFRFTDNRVVLHTDTSLLPSRKAAWASWNYRITDTSGQLPTLTYNMNILQRLQTTHTYLVTLNQEIDDDYVIDEFHYAHPVYNTAMIEAQKRWHEISGIDRIHYCGAYWFNGFHEDGVKSGLRVRDMIEGM
jgi:predicted NAD/FAD-binding protein